MKFGDLRGILQYVPQFRGRTFVVALDGAIVASENFSNILLDLAVLRSLNVRVVLVHGAAQQIRELAEKRDVELSNSDGTGITDEKTLEVSLDAITRLNSGVMQNLTFAQELPAALAERGLIPLTHKLLPPNDGCISLGQAAYGQRMLALRRTCPL